MFDGMSFRAVVYELVCLEGIVEPGQFLYAQWWRKTNVFLGSQGQLN